jgi:ribosomal protein S18 acetylase RimI-like enzyme
MEIREIKSEETWEIRHKEMWPEKPLDYVKLPQDQGGIHYGLFVKEELVSIISLFVVGKKAQFRKFATKSAFQGRGFGSSLLRHLIEEVRGLSVEELWCNARKDKAGFYRRFGIEETEETFIKEGQEYVVMTLRLLR